MRLRRVRQTACEQEATAAARTLHLAALVRGYQGSLLVPVDDGWLVRVRAQFSAWQAPTWTVIRVSHRPRTVAERASSALPQFDFELILQCAGNRGIEEGTFRTVAEAIKWGLP